jgi:DNA-binding MarR family transcriptional regulator
MNAIFFGLKRAHHGTLRVTRTALVAMGLTAARFDMLYVLHESDPGGTLQSNLRRTLGVSAPTVSRMLKSLEQLGLVVRTRPEGDRRQRWVKLTAAGRSRIDAAIVEFIDEGTAQLLVDTALAPDRWYDPTHCFGAMGALESTLFSIRGSFRDSATLHYPWHPDD